MSNYDELLPYANTEAERECINALIKTGSQDSAAKELEINNRTLTRRIARIRARAASKGFSPAHNMTHTVPDGFKVKGVSTYYDNDGNPKAQWVKSAEDAKRQAEIIKEAIEEFYKELPPLKTPKTPKEKFNQDIIPWFQIGDAHIGMLAHEAETGQNFDIKIAERELLVAMTALIEDSQPCERCVIHDLGDATHYENFAAITEHGGNMLDYDGRFPKMIRAYSRVMRAIIESALTKFKYVDIIINQGNHSRTNDIWMVELLNVAYGKTNRVNVLDNSCVFTPYRMGNTFVMTHHSDKCKPNKLANVMATDYADDWGESKYRYIDIGHIHHQMVVKEHPGVTIESWNQLAAADKWAHEAGWRHRQCLTRVDRSKTYGEVGRKKITVDEVRDRIIAKSGKKGSEPPKRRKVYSV